MTDQTLSRCDARIRPFTDGTEIQCECHAAQHESHQHHGTVRDYAYPGSATTIYWYETDRRNYRGEWFHCFADRACILPANHRGDCAR